MRLDQALAARNLAPSRRKARELIAAGAVLVNGRPVRVASREVADNDHLRVVEGLPAITVIASTDEWIAVNKPAGLPTQPERERKQISLEEILRAQYQVIYLVHRLDTPTSGAVVFARTQKAAAYLSKLFAERAIRKTYLARIAPPIERELTIDTPLDGKEAITIVRPRSDDIAEVEILAGRQHQIRRHLQSIGHAVVGDRRYGGPSAPRLMLHAWRLQHESLGVLEAVPPDELR